MQKNIILTASMAVLTLLITGCSSDPNVSAEESYGFGDISISGMEGVTAVLDFYLGSVQLPLDQFRVQSPTFIRLVDSAKSSVIDRCVVDAGFEGNLVPLTPTELPREDRKYGVWSIKNASAFGFDLNPEQFPANPDVLALGQAYNDAYENCMGEAKDKLLPQLEFHDSPQIDVQIAAAALKQVRESQAGKELLATAMDCIEQRGYIVNGDRTQISEQYSDASDETRAKVALAEATCFTETGAIQGLYDLEARYQTAYMAQNEAQLVALSERIKEVEDSLRAAAQGE